MSNPKIPPSDPKKLRIAAENMAAEVFESSQPETDSKPHFSAETLNGIFSQVRDRYDKAEEWTITALESDAAANPIAVALSGDNTPVILETHQGRQVMGMLQLGHSSEPRRNHDRSSPSADITVLAGSSEETGELYELSALPSLSADSGHDPEAESPLCLIASPWPQGFELRGVEVTLQNTDDADSVMLTTRRISRGYELDYLPEEEAVLKSDSVTIRLTVLPKGGSDD